PLVLLARPAPPLMSISCYPLHRALHSFPTRRSSDLPQGGAPLPAARHGRRDHHRERPGLRGDRRGLGAAGAAAHDPVLRERAPHRRRRPLAHRDAAVGPPLSPLVPHASRARTSRSPVARWAAGLAACALAVAAPLTGAVPAASANTAANSAAAEAAASDAT